MGTPNIFVSSSCFPLSPPFCAPSPGVSVARVRHGRDPPCRSPSWPSSGTAQRHTDGTVDAGQFSPGAPHRERSVPNPCWLKPSMHPSLVVHR